MNKFTEKTSNERKPILKTVVFGQSVTALVSSICFCMFFYIFCELERVYAYILVLAGIAVLIVIGSFFPFVSTVWSFCYLIKRIIKRNFVFSDLIPFAISIVSLFPCISMYKLLALMGDSSI